VIGAAAVASAAVTLPVAHSFGGCKPVPVNPPSGYYASEADETCGVKESHAKPVAGSGPREHVRIRWRYGCAGRLGRRNASACPGERCSLAPTVLVPAAVRLVRV